MCVFMYVEQNQVSEKCELKAKLNELQILNKRMKMHVSLIYVVFNCSCNGHVIQFFV